MFKNPFHSANKDPFSDLNHASGTNEISETEMSLFNDEDITDTINDPGAHFVNPHHVDEYDRIDGTHVDDYWRDGDHDTTIDRTIDEGGGYEQTNPDDDISNNFGN
jgi:hypothetical protein